MDFRSWTSVKADFKGSFQCIPAYHHQFAKRWSIPRASGGDPYLQLKMIYPKRYSPHERGQLGSVEAPETEDSVRYSVQAILPESQFDTGVS